MRWSERPPVVRSRFARLERFYSDRCALSVAVAHLVLVRPMARFAGFTLLIVLVFLAATSSRAVVIYDISSTTRVDARSNSSIKPQDEVGRQFVQDTPRVLHITAEFHCDARASRSPTHELTRQRSTSPSGCFPPALRPSLLPI
jgi:hypothetical protein